MATERLPMRHLRESLRLKWVVQRSHRETARSLGISAGVVGSVVSRATRLALTWAAVEGLTDDALERAMYGQPDAASQDDRPEPDLVHIHQELRRQEVTLELLHLEYLAQHPTGYRYSAFCDRYRAWRQRQRLSMRQVYKAGEKAFVDCAGLHPTLVEVQTGALELQMACQPRAGIRRVYLKSPGDSQPWQLAGAGFITALRSA